MHGGGAAWETDSAAEYAKQYEPESYDTVSETGMSDETGTGGKEADLATADDSSNYEPTYQDAVIWDTQVGVDGTDNNLTADNSVSTLELGEQSEELELVSSDSPEMTDEAFALAMGAVSFSDVSSADWYGPYVEWAASEGLISGYKDAAGNLTGQFGPQDTLTRAQLAVILWRNAGSPTASSAGFIDTRGHWAEKAVDWCAQQGIVTGYDGTGNFGPDDNITREQLCTMLWRNAGRPGGGVSLGRWVDGNKVSAFAMQAVAWAAGQGIMAGSVGNAQVLLLPNNGATRAEAAKMLAVALGGYLGTTPEHQVLKSIEGWWTTNGLRNQNPYLHIHDGVVDYYSHGGTLLSTQSLTENDIRWYSAGSFMNGRSKAGYAFLYNGGYRYICADGLQIYAYGRGNQYSGSSSWQHSGVLEG